MDGVSEYGSRMLLGVQRASTPGRADPWVEYTIPNVQLCDVGNVQLCVVGNVGFVLWVLEFEAFSNVFDCFWFDSGTTKPRQEVRGSSNRVIRLQIGAREAWWPQ